MADLKKKDLEEMRSSIRVSLRAQVKFTHPQVGELNLHTGNISDGGAYVLAEGNSTPALGELVAVQVQGMGDGDAPVVMMRIVRLDADGMGLAFTDSDDADSER